MTIKTAEAVFSKVSPAAAARLNTAEDIGNTGRNEEKFEDEKRQKVDSAAKHSRNVSRSQKLPLHR